MADPTPLRARPLGTARYSARAVELARMGVGDPPEPVLLKLWDASPEGLSDVERAIRPIGGELRRRDGRSDATSAIAVLPPDIQAAALPEPLAAALAALQRMPEAPTSLRCGARTLTFDHTYVMAIINLTDDSFSGDGFGTNVDAAVRRAVRAVEEGAHIVDIGGESARADVPIREEEEEIARVVPVIERIIREVDVVVSLDSWKPPVADAAAAAGATLLNDIGGMKLGPGMAQVAAKHRLPLVLNHTWWRPKVRPPSPPVYDDVVDHVYAFLQDRIAEAMSQGVPEDLLVLDPGVAFGKSHDEDLEVMRRLGELRPLGRPLMLAHSRKHVIGSTLGGLAPDQRVEGTLAASALAVGTGVDIVRVHDVEATVRALRVADALVRAPLGAFAPGAETWPFPAKR